MNKLFKLKVEEPKLDITTADTKSEIEFYEQGRCDSKEANGHIDAFSQKLQQLFYDYKERCQSNEQEQANLKKPHLESKSQLEGKRNAKNVLIDRKQKKKLELSEEINRLKERKIRVKKNPVEEGLPDESSKAPSLIIGALLLVPITIYLLVFYLSASYSAFFREIQVEMKLSQTIFAPEALSAAWNDGFLEVVLILTIPFAFMGLGYLIHMFNKQKKKGWFIKVLSLYSLTFVFDAILAYLIEEKIYNATKTLMTPDFGLAEAFASVSFWSIIFSGFVVYVIWGLVFDFIMEEFEKSNPLKVELKSIKDSLTDLNLQKKEVENELESEFEALDRIDAELHEIQAKIDGFIFPKKRYKTLHAQYVAGWSMYVAGEMPVNQNVKDEMLAKVTQTSEKFLEVNHLVIESGQNITYRNFTHDKV